MEHIKLQLGCLIVLLYIALIYFREHKVYNQSLNKTFFDELLMLGIVSVALDGITAYTVNHLDTVPLWLNQLLHALFLIGLDSVIFALCLYILHIAGVYPKKAGFRAVIFAPFLANIILVLYNIDSLEYVIGISTNYSMGSSAYTCFLTATIYILIPIVVFFRHWHYIDSRKRISIMTYLMVLAAVTLIQMLYPEALITSVGVTVFLLGIYLNLEAPALKELERYHSEMVMGFSTLIERRDNSTGGHIRRTSSYVELIVRQLQNTGQYGHILTDDYAQNLIQAAPMHDIGKVAIPDAILQKPGRLTDEEFAAMRLHAEYGGKIIQETFAHLGNHEYFQMAYEVARFHHEKWNGSGYPEGLSGQDIPLCARVMAVADVFDAVSARRCYRQAMSLEQSFSIIEQGRGRDFDPVIADAFLTIRDQVEQVHHELAAS